MFRSKLKTVIKGFTVPSGFVLHYEDKLGNDLSATEGEFINTSHQFQKVMSGEVPGWYLTKQQSTYDVFRTDEDDDIEFEEHTLTPWGDRVDVLGIPLIPDTVLASFNKVTKLGGLKAKGKHPEISDHIDRIRKQLKVYGAKGDLGDQEILDGIDLVNRNIQLLLSLEKTPYIQNLFSIENAPNVLDSQLQQTLVTTREKSVNLDKLSHDLMTQMCAHFGIEPEELVKEIGSGMTREAFEANYGEFVRTNSVLVEGNLVTKDEAKEYIEQAIKTIPQEVRPLVLNYLGAEDLLNNTVDDLIKNLKEADYLFSQEITLDQLRGVGHVAKIEADDLPRVKVMGMDYISSRYEYLKRLMSTQALVALTSEENDEGTDQTPKDIVSEIIENYIEYLGGDPEVYKTLCHDWIEGTNSKVVAAFKSWVEGKNTPDVRTYRQTFTAIQTAHSGIWESLDDKLYRVVSFGEKLDRSSLPKLSIKAIKPTVSFTLDKEAAEKLVDSSTNHVMMEVKTSAKRILLIPSLWMAKSYWKEVGGKSVFINRGIPVEDENLEVVVRGEDIVIKSFENDILEVVL